MSESKALPVHFEIRVVAAGWTIPMHTCVCVCVEMQIQGKSEEKLKMEEVGARIQYFTFQNVYYIS